MVEIPFDIFCMNNNMIKIYCGLQYHTFVHLIKY